MKLVDQFGQPITSSAVDSPQTSKLAMLHRSVAGHPARGLTPQRLNTLLLDAEQGNLIAQHELFADMEERDAHLFAELSKRKRAVIKLDWSIKAPRNASKSEEDLAAYATEVLEDMHDFEDVLFDALDGISHGFSALEIEWQRIERDWTFKALNHRPQSWFQLDQDTRTEIRLRDLTPSGSALAPFGWVLHKHKAVSGYQSRSGLGRVLIWPYLFKHFSVGDLAEFLDIYGLPIGVGKYPSKATNDEQATLWRAVAGIGHNARGIIPDSMSIDWEQAASGTEKPFEAMIKWCEDSVSKAVLGSTMSGNSGHSGLGSGLADAQTEARLEIRDSDCKQLAGTLTRDLIYPLLQINKGFADARRCPRFVFDTQEADDLKLYADSLPKLVEAGAQVPVNWVNEKLRIPQPKDGEAVLTMAKAQASSAQPKPEVKPTAAAKTEDAGTASLRQAMTALQSQYADQAALDFVLGDMESTLHKQATRWLAPAIAALESADSIEAALALLVDQNQFVPPAVLTEALARAMFVTELFGADSVQADLT